MLNCQTTPASIRLLFSCKHQLQWQATNRSSFVEALAFSWDPASGNIVHMVRLQDRFEFHPVTERGWRHAAWSSCGRHLLIHEQTAPGSAAAQAVAWLTVIDVAQSTAIVQSAVPCISQSKWWAAGWHPCLPGIILAHSARQDHISALQHAGLTAGTLPDQQRIHEAGFSADARFLVSFTPSLSPWRGEFHVLCCSVDRLQISFAVEQRLDLISQSGWCPRKLAWLPYTSTLFATGSSADQEHFFIVQGVAAASSTQNKLPAHQIVSPSGLFYVDRSNFGLCICDALTGNLLWGSIGSDPRWPELQKSNAGYPEFELIALQLQCNSLRTASLAVWGWIPSGRGLVSSTNQHGDGRPPALHIFWFA